MKSLGPRSVPSIATDSGVLYAAFDVHDKPYQGSIGLLRKPGAGLVTNLPVLTEVTYLLRREPGTQRAFFELCIAGTGHRSRDIWRSSAHRRNNVQVRRPARRLR